MPWSIAASRRLAPSATSKDWLSRTNVTVGMDGRDSSGAAEKAVGSATAARDARGRMDPRRQRDVRVERHGTGRPGDADAVAAEEPLEIRVLGKPIGVVMRTPGDDLDLVAGFLATEGIVAPDDLSAVAPCVGPDGAPVENVVNASLVEGASLDVERFRRNLFASSSCG